MKATGVEGSSPKLPWGQKDKESPQAKTLNTPAEVGSDQNQINHVDNTVFVDIPCRTAAAKVSPD